METIAAETLALTKLNWNHSELDGLLPITLHAASKVKTILRWLPDADVPTRAVHELHVTPRRMDASTSLGHEGWVAISGLV